HLVRLCPSGPEESAERSDAAVERWQLGASGLLGSKSDRMGDRWHGEPALHGCAAGDRAMGASVGAGGAGWLGGDNAQRHGFYALWWTCHLGLCREEWFSFAATAASSDEWHSRY